MVVIGVADGVPVGLRDGNEIPALVVLVFRHALGGGNGGQLAQLVIAVLLVPVAAVCREDVTGLVVGILGYVALAVRDSLEPALRGVGVPGHVAQSVSLRGQITVLVVGIGGDVTQRVRDLGEIICRVVGIACSITQSIRNGSDPADLIKGVACLAALRVSLGNEPAREVVFCLDRAAVSVGDRGKQAVRGYMNPETKNLGLRSVPAVRPLFEQIQGIIGIAGGVAVGLNTLVFLPNRLN